MSNTQRYAAWPDPGSRMSEMWENGRFQRLC